MNLKKLAFTAIAGMCALGSFISPVGAQTVVDDDSTVTVELTESGTFSVYICEPNYNLTTGTGVTSSTGGTATGHIGICYADTQSYRTGFTTSLVAGDFMNQDVTGVSIPAENFSATFMYNPHQGQWGWTNPNEAAGTCPHVSPGNVAGSYDVGDIGGFIGASGASTSSSNTVTGHPGENWVGGDFGSSQFVGYGWSGVGTANGSFVPCDPAHPMPVSNVVNGTYAGIDVELVVPPGAPAGTYVSTLELSLTLGQP